MQPCKACRGTPFFLPPPCRVLPKKQAVLICAVTSATCRAYPHPLHMTVHGRRGKQQRLHKKQAVVQSPFCFSYLAGLSTVHTQACPRRLCKTAPASAGLPCLAVSSRLGFVCLKNRQNTKSCCDSCACQTCPQAVHKPVPVRCAKPWAGRFFNAPSMLSGVSGYR